MSVRIYGWGIRKLALCCCGAVLVASAAVLSIGCFSSTMAQTPGDTRAAREAAEAAHLRAVAEQRELEKARLKDVFNGVVDLYLAVDQVQAKQPAVEGVQFSGIKEVSGKPYLEFDKRGERPESWLIDPTKIVAVRIVR